MSVEAVPGFASLNEADRNELRMFEAYVRARDKAARGEALDAPEFLYLAIYGADHDEPRPR